MRVSFSLVLLLIYFNTLGQFKKEDRVTCSFDNVSLEVIFDTLSSQTNYFFSYNSALLPKGSLYVISADDEPIEEFLSRLFEGTGLKYSFFKDQIILNYEAPKQEVKKKNFFSITGKVFDEDGRPLNNANVFLDGTTLGAFSDVDGNFKIELVPPGYYSIVFSHVGYENGIYQISESNGGLRIQNHQMEMDLGQLDQVEVVSERVKRSEEGWMEHYTVFTKELLGSTENADNCVIENPETLDFTFDRKSNTLTAYAKKPIEIRNDALGYRISYFLESFRKEKNGDLRFRGQIRFRNLEPLNGAERRLWKKNRRESYFGSFNHFKQSLLDDNLKSQGFRIYKMNAIHNFRKKESKKLDPSDILVFKGDHYELDFKGYLAVEYKNEKESIRFLENNEAVGFLYSNRITSDGILVKEPGSQTSIIRLLKGPVRLDLSGEVMDSFGLTTFGYWSWERTADLVPVNYDPKFDNL